MSDRSATPPLFSVLARPILESHQSSPRIPANRPAALLVGVLAVVALFGLAWAGALAGGRGWLIAGATAGYVAFVLLSRAALRLWRADWEDLSPDLRLFKDRSLRWELRSRRGPAPRVAGFTSAHNVSQSGRGDTP